MKHYKIEDLGTIVLFYPLTDEARDWWTEYVDPDCQTLGQWHAVGRRCAGEIIEAIIEQFEPWELV